MLIVLCSKGYMHMPRTHHLTHAHIHKTQQHLYTHIKEQQHLHVYTQLKVLKDGDPNLSGDHIREGLAGVVSVSVPNPEFEGQTKTRLGNPEVKKIVEGVVAQVRFWWFYEG